MHIIGHLMYQITCINTWREGNKFLILILYVDDILLACNDRNKMEEIKQNLNKSFEMTDVGKPKFFSWFGNKKIQRVLKITQEKYIWERPAEMGHRARAVPFSRKRRSV